MRKMTLACGVRPGDIAVILFLLLLAAVLLFAGTAPASTRAQYVSVVTETGTFQVPLNENRVIPITSGRCRLTLTVENGTACITESDCPSGVCTASGAISVPGQSIVCLPARVLVKILGEGGSSAYAKDADVILP